MTAPDSSGPADATATRSTERIAQVAALVGIAFVTLVAVGFGAKTSCTTGPPDDSPSCDAIDDWAWAGLIAVAIVSALGAACRQRFTILLTLAGVTIAITAIGMLAVSPT